MVVTQKILMSFALIAFITAKIFLFYLIFQRMSAIEEMAKKRKQIWLSRQKKLREERVAKLEQEKDTLAREAVSKYLQSIHRYVLTNILGI